MMDNSASEVFVEASEHEALQDNWIDEGTKGRRERIFVNEGSDIHIHTSSSFHQKLCSRMEMAFMLIILWIWMTLNGESDLCHLLCTVETGRWYFLTSFFFFFYQGRKHGIWRCGA